MIERDLDCEQSTILVKTVGTIPSEKAKVVSSRLKICTDIQRDGSRGEVVLAEMRARIGIRIV